MENEVRIPDIEIVVGCASDQVAVFAFYMRADVHQGYDILCGIADQDARSVIRQILWDAIKALDNADWFDVDGLRTALDQEMEEPPF